MTLFTWSMQSETTEPSGNPMEKSPWHKKKSGSSMILYNRVPGNKWSYSGKCVGTKDVEKKDLIL